MRLLFTADIHIKLGQKNVPVDWAKNRYQLFIEQLVKLQENCDLLVLGGDTFDRIPSMDEVEIYFDIVANCNIPTIIFSGNHEAIKKDTTFLTYLAKSTNRLNRKVKVIDDYYSVGNVDFIPYNKLKEWEKDPDNTFYSLHNKVLCTHVRGEIPPHVKPEIDLSLFNRWQVVLAGDLHSYENCQQNILYPGSPMTTSFHRNLVDTGIIELNTETLEHTWHKLELPQLIRKTVSVTDPKPKTDYHHTIYEVEGDLVELGNLENSELIDKKVVKRDTDSALILDNDMTLSEEVGEYLKYILELPDDIISKTLKELQNYADKF